MNTIEKMVIIINGNGGCGKDTFVKSIQELIPRTINVSIVDPIYKMAKIVGWDGITKEQKDRMFLHKLKMLSEEYNDYPNRYVMNRFNEFINNKNEFLMFIHVRESNNIKYLVEEIGKISNVPIKTLFVNRPSHNVVWGNEADDNVDNYNYDYAFINDQKETKEEIADAAKTFFAKIILELKDEEE